MDDYDWAQAWKLFSDLWPKGAANISGELQLSYRRVCGENAIGKVQVALRALSETCRWMPKPMELRKQISSDRRHSNQETGITKCTSWPDMIRQNMSGNTGRIREEHAAMSDNEVQVWYWGAMAQYAHKTYCRRRDCDFCEDHPSVREALEKRDRFTAVEGAVLE